MRESVKICMGVGGFGAEVGGEQISLSLMEEILDVIIGRDVNE